MKTKENQGITLIALVITIIVLLILAGVTIATLAGNNGILTRATDAKEQTEETSEEELRRLTVLEAATNLEETTHKEGEKTVKIPAGCAVSQVEGENTLKDGLVIIDSNGNEWVWIEVPESVTKEAETDDEIRDALIYYAQDYGNNNCSDTWYDGCGLEPEEYSEKYSKMLQSIKEKNGFYIGRYEVGSFDDPISLSEGNDLIWIGDTSRKPVIQRDAYPYTYVLCNQAEDLAETLAPGKNTSTLMFGIQWDLVLKYLEVNADWDETHDASYYLKTDSNSWGNYLYHEFDITRGQYFDYENDNYIPVEGKYTKGENKSVLLTTGATERNMKLNIYDLAGNVGEFTLEKGYGDGGYVTNRGGSVVNGSDWTHAYYRFIRTPIATNTLGFRATLY